jgi:hypothetical protein
MLDHLDDLLHGEGGESFARLVHQQQLRIR